MPREETCRACADAAYHRHRAVALRELVDDLNARAGRLFAARDDARAFEVRAVADEVQGRVCNEFELVEKYDAGQHVCQQELPRG